MGDGDIIGQGRALEDRADASDVDDGVVGAEESGLPLGRIQLTAVALAVVEGEQMEVETLAMQIMGKGDGIHATGDDDNGFHAGTCERNSDGLMARRKFRP